MSSFDTRAKEWDKKDIRVNGAKIIAKAIEQRVQLHKNMEIMDFGVGTGLLGFEIASRVKSLDGVDTSAGMIETLQEKNSPELFIKPIHQDIIQKPLTKEYDGIVSSMTLHHVEDLKKFFTTIYRNLKENGFIAIADLQKEDGTFHSDNAGVFHFGFKEKTLCNIVKSCGFKNVVLENINTIKKPHKTFGVFLLTATM